jgi:ribosomal protein RSM22 (predicted rRNA methylase)
MDPETKVNAEMCISSLYLTALQALIKSLVQVTRNSNSFASKTISDVITGKGGGLVGLIPLFCQ